MIVIGVHVVTKKNHFFSEEVYTGESIFDNVFYNLEIKFSPERWIKGSDKCN